MYQAGDGNGAESSMVSGSVASAVIIFAVNFSGFFEVSYFNFVVYLFECF